MHLDKGRMLFLYFQLQVSFVFSFLQPANIKKSQQITLLTIFFLSQTHPLSQMMPFQSITHFNRKHKKLLRFLEEAIVLCSENYIISLL